MILKTLVRFVGVSFMLTRTAAQPYENNHQQYMKYLSSDLKRLDTKALTPVKEGEQEPLKWAFASTLKDSNSRDLKTLLVKLNENALSPNEFAFEWAYEYRATKLSLDVYDVFYQNNLYILCGQAKSRQSGKNRGFIATVKASGAFKRAKLYPETSVLASIVPWQSGTGYIAVGKAQVPDGQTKTDAVVLSVGSKLKPECGRRFFGKFDEADPSMIDSGFRKVIKYKKKDEKFYAVVGETTVFKDEFCSRRSEVLVALVDKKCEVSESRQYGGLDPIQNQGAMISARGVSITQWDLKKKKGGLVITGNVRSTSNCEENVYFDDVLVFKTKGNLDIDWTGRYSIQPGLEVRMSICYGLKFWTWSFLSKAELTQKHWLLVSSAFT